VDVYSGGIERLEHGQETPRVVRGLDGKDACLARVETVALENVLCLLGVVDDETDGADIRCIGHGDGADVHAFATEELAHVRERAGHILETDGQLRDHHCHCSLT